MRINAEGSPRCLYAYDAQSQACSTTAVEAWDDEQLSSLSLLILLPASWLYHTQTQVASKNNELLSKSIPYAVEEELSNEVEDNYFAFKLNEDGTQNVVAIEKQRLDQVNEQIKAQQLNVVGIYSEVDWIPAKATVISIWSDAENSLLRFGVDQAMNVPNHQINQLLPVFGQQANSILCNQAALISSQELPVKEGLSEAVCCQYLIQQQAVNLYVDELKQGRVDQEQDSWRLVKWLTAVLMLSWLGIQLFQLTRLSQDIDAIKQQQKDLFQQNHPDAANAELMDPFAALQSRLKINDSQPDGRRNVLIEAVHHLGMASQQQQQISINGLRLIDQQLEIQIAAANMTQINGFHQSLQSLAPEFTVRIGVNELADDSTFKSTLTMVPR